jgi:hypothetical protein
MPVDSTVFRPCSASAISSLDGSLGVPSVEGDEPFSLSLDQGQGQGEEGMLSSSNARRGFGSGGHSPRTATDMMLMKKRLQSTDAAPVVNTQAIPPAPPAPEIKVSSPSLSHSRAPFSDAEHTSTSGGISAASENISDAAALARAINELKARKQESLRRLEAFREMSL